MDSFESVVNELRDFQEAQEVEQELNQEIISYFDEIFTETINTFNAMFENLNLGE